MGLFFAQQPGEEQAHLLAVFFFQEAKRSAPVFDFPELAGFGLEQFGARGGERKKDYCSWLKRVMGEKVDGHGPRKFKPGHRALEGGAAGRSAPGRRSASPDSAPSMERIDRK
ncbi:MAG: hypothetical protein IIC13_02365 [SAR324 cluster bacterium]|nr:hypothetical protein [SAR324 cluster bacterium]